MSLSIEDLPDLKTIGMDDDCLIELMSRAENEQGSVNDNPDLAQALDARTVMVTSDGDAELMCVKCPVMCSVKSVGEGAIVLFQGTEDCAKQS